MSKERTKDDSQMGGQGTTDTAVPATLAGQPDNDQRSSGAAAQHPQPGTPPLVAAEDELAPLIAGLLSDKMSVSFFPNGEGVDVHIDPYDAESYSTEYLSAFGPDPLTALRVALDWQET